MKTQILVILCFIWFNNFGCNCLNELDVKEAYDNTEVIISVKVIEKNYLKPDTSKTRNGELMIRGLSHLVSIKLQVIEIFKGQNITSKTLILKPENSNCDFHFNLNHNYLVYAYSNEGILSTSICTRTALLDNNPDLLFLHKQEKH